MQTLVDEGRITAEEADHHPQRTLITNSLDGREDIELDLSVRETRAGDRYLLCSDGLSGVVSEDTLRDTLLGEADADVVVERLVDLALKGGGPDNVTAIVADVVEVETKPPSAVPITVGAAADGVVQRSPDDTPAGKAALLRPQPDETEDTDDDEAEAPPRRRGRLVLVLVLLAALLAAGAYGAYRWSQMQYYVGATNGNVAIFRGLSQDIGPVSTSRVYSDERIPLSDLPTYQQERVRANITTSSLGAAEKVVATLREQAELCEQARNQPTPSPSPSASGRATPSPSPSPSGTGEAAASCGNAS